MNKSKHTPGPWEAEPEMTGDGTPVHGSWQVSGCADDGEPVCIWASEADARLIASVPEAVDLAKAVAAHFQDTDAPLGAMARAWLAKATGQED